MVLLADVRTPMDHFRYLVRASSRSIAALAIGLLTARTNPLAQNAHVPPSDLTQALARTAAYLDDYAQRFSALVADEVYDMVSMPERPARASQQRLRSDLVLLAVEQATGCSFATCISSMGMRCAITSSAC